MEVLFLELLGLLLTLLMIGLGTERGVEVVKSFVRLLADKFSQIPYLGGHQSFVLAAVVAGLVAFVPGIELDYINQFLPDLGEGFSNVLEALLILFAASKSHDTLFKPNY